MGASRTLTHTSGNADRRRGSARFVALARRCPAEILWISPIVCLDQAPFATLMSAALKTTNKMRCRKCALRHECSATLRPRDTLFALRER